MAINRDAIFKCNLNTIWQNSKQKFRTALEAVKCSKLIAKSNIPILLHQKLYRCKIIISNNNNNL